MLPKYKHCLSTRETFYIIPSLYLKYTKLLPRLLTLVYQSLEMSLSHLNRGETPVGALPLSQLTLSEIKLTLGPHVIVSSILSLLSLSFLVKSP